MYLSKMLGYELYILLLLVTVTAEGQCPSKITCLLKRREACTQKSHDCGPCRVPYMETARSRSKFSGPDAIIDFIQNMMDSMNEASSAAHKPTESPPLAVVTSSILLPIFLKNSTIAGTRNSTTPTGVEEWKNTGKRKSINHTFSLTLTVICSLTGVSGILVAALCWYRLQNEVQLAQKLSHTTYKDNPKHIYHRTAQNSHYARQCQIEKAQERSQMKPCHQLSTDSEPDVDDFTIYECPGLAPTGEMEVHNPLFDPTRTTK
ncbi:hypothetical protein GDO86_015659 [Hymenochirus boettgeri]|uniref:Neural proliferation differentiation and control protein 1 n=1 Tax=Hymenochirus boettgeri TaxID=247094 RepID=A0A8T2JY86_9PIPI|nr:hypothetical protein GDO86_015659 [Hymenochirus boettgeri]